MILRNYSLSIYTIVGLGMLLFCSVAGADEATIDSGNVVFSISFCSAAA